MRYLLLEMIMKMRYDYYNDVVVTRYGWSGSTGCNTLFYDYTAQTYV